MKEGHYQCGLCGKRYQNFRMLKRHYAECERWKRKIVKKMDQLLGSGQLTKSPKTLHHVGLSGNGGQTAQ